jgi:outer membrane protein OmpA-like peptidoglycan-associated protein
MNRIWLIIFPLVLVVGWPLSAGAGDLSFPTTEEEIVQSLSFKDGKAVFENITYESKNGRVYKIINGVPYRVRGLQGIVDSEIVPKAGAHINFDFDSSRIKPDSYALLNEFGNAMTGELSTAVLIVAGHTDSKGSFEYNKNLSEDRAKSVVAYLTTRRGVSPDRLIVKGYGKDKPIASNDTEEGRTQNRRVEFIRIE